MHLHGLRGLVLAAAMVMALPSAAQNADIPRDIPERAHKLIHDAFIEDAAIRQLLGDIAYHIHMALAQPQEEQTALKHAMGMEHAFGCLTQLAPHAGIDLAYMVVSAMLHDETTTLAWQQHEQLVKAAATVPVSLDTPKSCP